MLYFWLWQAIATAFFSWGERKVLVRLLGLLVLLLLLVPLSAQAREVSFYDVNGVAAAFIDSENMTVYLWDGEPVAYVKGESLYGFNGKHLGWFTESMIWNNQGRPLGYMADAANRAVQPITEPKGAKHALPKRAKRQQPTASITLKADWSSQLLTPFLRQGRVSSTSPKAHTKQQ